MTTYPKANTRKAWYASRYPGSRMDPNCGVLHTTEGRTLPGYQGGATAPNYTAVPNFRRKRLDWYAHFPDETSSRALRNLAGGVETNTANVIQVELVGTCDPKYRKSWSGNRAGEDYVFWPDAPSWALDDLAAFVAWVHKTHGVPIQGPADWRAYPDSYGAGGQRFTNSAWRRFVGWCGHQHVPENVHGDPGDLEWATIARKALALAAPIKPRTIAGKLLVGRVRYITTRETEFRSGPGKQYPVTRVVPKGYVFTGKFATKHYRRQAKPKEWAPADNLTIYRGK